MSAKSTPYRFRPRFIALAFLSLSLGVILIATASVFTMGTTGTVFGFLTGTACIFLGFSYLRSPIWKLALDVLEDELVVWDGEEERLRVPWSEIKKIQVDQEHQTCYIQGSSKKQSILIPGPSAPASYDLRKKKGAHRSNFIPCSRRTGTRLYMYHRSKGLSFSAALRDIQSSKPKNRVLAAKRLGHTDSQEEKIQAVSALSTALSDPRPEVRSTSCLSLAELEDSSTWELLSICLDDTTPQVRQCAAIALGSLGVHQSFLALKKALEDGPADLRFQAASSLVEIDAEAAYEPLLRALEGEEDPEVLGAIALSLSVIGNAACADQIANMLDNPKASCRLDAAYALAQLGDLRAKETLAAALNGTDGSWDAISALEELGDHVSDTLADFLKSNTGDPRVRIRAAGAMLGAEPNHAHKEIARHCLLEALSSRKLDIRGLSVQEIHNVGESWAIAPLYAFSKRFKSRRLSYEIQLALKAIASRCEEKE